MAVISTSAAHCRSISMRWSHVISVAQVPACIVLAVDADFVHALTAGPASAASVTLAVIGHFVQAASVPKSALSAGHSAACGIRPGKHA